MNSAEAQARVKQQRDILDKYPSFPPTSESPAPPIAWIAALVRRPPLESISKEVEERVVQEFEGLKV